MADRTAVIQGLIELHLSGKGGPEAVAAMKQIISQAKEVEKAVGGFGEKGAKSVGALEKSFISLGKTVAGYFAVGAISNFLRDSYVGFARTERQALATENQIKALGQAAQGAGFREFIEQLSAASGILDDDLVPAMQRAIGAFKDYNTAQEIVTIAAKFAAAGTGDVASNVDAIARAFQTGRTQGLAPFGVSVKGLGDDAQDLNVILRELIKNSGQVGAGFKDSQADLDEIKRLYDGLSDSAGKLFSKLVHPFVGLPPRAVPFQAPFGPAAPTAAQLQFAREQEARDQAATKKAADDKVKAEQDAAKKIQDLNLSTQQALIREVADIYEVGTNERLNLEIALNDSIRKAAVENAKLIGADVEAINALFDEREKARTRDFINATGPRVDQGGEDPETRRLREARDEQLKIDEEWAAAERRLEDDRFEYLLTQEERLRRAKFATAHASLDLLNVVFGKNKSFAIATAIINTALGITEVWTDKSLSFYEKVAGIITVAASGAAQIASIRSASVGGGGGGGSPSVASAPTSRAAPPSGYQPATIAPVSAATMANISGSSGTGATGTIVVNIGTALGDRQSMAKAAREFARILRNDQGAMR